MRSQPWFRACRAACAGRSMNRLAMKSLSTADSFLMVGVADYAVRFAYVPELWIATGAGPEVNGAISQPAAFRWDRLSARSDVLLAPRAGTLSSHSCRWRVSVLLGETIPGGLVLLLDWPLLSAGEHRPSLW